VSALEDGLAQRSLSADISRAVVRVVADYTGRGPTKVRTSIRDDLVVVLLRETLTKAETRLRERGEAVFVNESRRRFQSAMREELVTAIEGLTGRRVTSFMSDHDVLADMAVELFVLDSSTAGD
jgi:uncharacterized protein YbcI